MHVCQTQSNSLLWPLLRHKAKVMSACPSCGLGVSAPCVLQATEPDLTHTAPCACTAQGGSTGGKEALSQRKHGLQRYTSAHHKDSLYISLYRAATNRLLWLLNLTAQSGGSPKKAMVSIKGTVKTLPRARIKTAQSTEMLFSPSQTFRRPVIKFHFPPEGSERRMLLSSMWPRTGSFTRRRGQQKSHFTGTLGQAAISTNKLFPSKSAHTPSLLHLCAHSKGRIWDLSSTFSRAIPSHLPWHLMAI